MRTLRVALGSIVAATLAGPSADAQAPPTGPTFDVVSIKPSAPETGPARTANIVTQRPDGGLTTTRTPVSSTLISRAYPATSAADTVGFPDWARRAFFDVSAASPLTTATAEQRTAMLRAMLADRFRLLAHTERRELPSYDLVLDRSDGRLGSGLTPLDLDCDATQMLRGPTGRHVVDKTGLRGAYRVNLAFELATVAPGAVAPPENAPSVFTAVREQLGLGLKLESSRTERDVLVIDRLERPTEN